MARANATDSDVSPIGNGGQISSPYTAFVCGIIFGIAIGITLALAWHNVVQGLI